MNQVRYGRTYRDALGYLVEIVPGAKITRVSDRGTLDRRVVQVRPIDAPGEQQQHAHKVGLTWSAPVDELVEIDGAA